MFNVRVEYDDVPIKHIAVQCSKCNKWFNGRDIVEKGSLLYKSNINWAEFKCPVCGELFGGMQHADYPSIKETTYPDVYKNCLKKKEVWQ